MLISIATYANGPRAVQISQPSSVPLTAHSAVRCVMQACDGPIVLQRVLMHEHAAGAEAEQPAAKSRSKSALARIGTKFAIAQSERLRLCLSADRR